MSGKFPFFVVPWGIGLGKPGLPPNSDMREFSTWGSFWNDQSACTGIDLFFTSYTCLQSTLYSLRYRLGKLNCFQNLDSFICFEPIFRAAVNSYVYVLVKHHLELDLILPLLHMRVMHISVCMQQRRKTLGLLALCCRNTALLLIPVILSDTLFSIYIPTFALIIKVTVLLFQWKLLSNSKSFKSGGPLVHPSDT